VGDLAHNHGAQIPLEPGTYSGVPGAPVEDKAAFNNFPYQYGVVERTFSEYKSGLLSQTLVSDYLNLPIELQDLAIKAGWESALVAGTGGDYEDGSPRYFSCQTCHLRPVSGKGCNKNAPVRRDLPLHDMTGGNYWMPDAIQYLDSQNKLRLGGGLSSVQVAALNDGKTRVAKQLSEAASLSVIGDVVRIVNFTGHKLISGYPEGRRMWLNIRWYDASDSLLREDGEYGPIGVQISGVDVESILDLDDPNTKIYEAHYGMTQEWANQLLSLGYSPDLALSYDRYTGDVDHTLADLGAQAPGTYHETFHFVLNNSVTKDNRIPSYGMSYDEARTRNCLPVPEDQYGSPGPGGTYEHWDEVVLNPPSGAVYAAVDLLYQPTSWEYIQFLYLANDGSNAFLADEGLYMLEGWLNTGMAYPFVMASTTWGTPPAPPPEYVIVDDLATWSISKQGELVGQTSTFGAGDKVGIVGHVVDNQATPLSGCQVYVEIYDSGNARITSLQEFSDSSGEVVLVWKTAKRQAADTYTAKVVDVIKSGYTFDPGSGVTEVDFVVQ
jgi:hypothetical protein